MHGEADERPWEPRRTHHPHSLDKPLSRSYHRRRRRRSDNIRPGAPLALGLVCNVFPVISFAREICTTCHSAYQRGQAPSSAVATTVDHFETVFKEIEATEATAARPLTKSVSEVIEIARKCNGAALALKDEVERRDAKAAKAKGNLFKAGVLAVKSVASPGARKVEKLEKVLQAHQSAMDARMLYSLW